MILKFENVTKTYVKIDEVILFIRNIDDDSYSNISQLTSVIVFRD